MPSTVGKILEEQTCLAIRQYLKKTIEVRFYNVKIEWLPFGSFRWTSKKTIYSISVSIENES